MLTRYPNKYILEAFPKNKPFFEWLNIIYSLLQINGLGNVLRITDPIFPYIKTMRKFKN